MSQQSNTTISLKFSIEFNKIAREAKSCYVAVGMITDQMFEFACRQLSNCDNLNILVGVHMPTTPSVFMQLKEHVDSEKIKAKIFVERFFHPKLYLFELSDGWIAFVGSGNFTKGGWQGNEELFLKSTDEQVCIDLLEKFKIWESSSVEISDKFIDLYTQSFSSNLYLEKQIRKATNDLLDHLNSNFNIDNIDFSAQFFKKADHLAFRPGVTHLDTTEILEERNKVRQKLYRLNDLIVKKMPTNWRIFAHYDVNHIASHIDTKNHHDFNVRSLWVGYGRSKSELKTYGHEATPLNYMRMQVIISYESFGVWLMPGKIHAGRVDRDYFQEQMKSEKYSERFFSLLSNLGERFWIEIAGDHQKVTNFSDSGQFKEYAQKDSANHYYFIIGTNYQIGDENLSLDHIVDTCLNDFTALYPLYQLIKHEF